MDDRRRSYCRNWSIITLSCKLGCVCERTTPQTCGKYVDVVDRPRETPDVLRAPVETPTPTKRPEKASCPECKQDLTFHDDRADCPSGHSWKLRRSRRRCPHCGKQLMTFSLTDPRWIVQRLLFFFCACGYTAQDSRLLVNPNGPGRYGGQRWSPRTGRLLSR